MRDMFEGAAGVPFFILLKYLYCQSIQKCCCQKGGKSDFTFKCALGSKKRILLPRLFFVPCSSTIIVANVNLRIQVMLSNRVTAECTLEFWSGTAKQP